MIYFILLASINVLRPINGKLHLHKGNVLCNALASWPLVHIDAVSYALFFYLIDLFKHMP